LAGNTGHPANVAAPAAEASNETRSMTTARELRIQRNPRLPERFIAVPNFECNTSRVPTCDEFSPRSAQKTQHARSYYW
jgi:hypothetical protein